MYVYVFTHACLCVVHKCNYMRVWSHVCVMCVCVCVWHVCSQMCVITMDKSTRRGGSGVLAVTQSASVRTASTDITAATAGTFYQTVFEIKG